MYRRDISIKLEKRLEEPRKFMQIIMGPRQTGKTTAVKQALDSSQIPNVFLNADRLVGTSASQLEIEWAQARELAKREGKAVLFIDEIQKIDDWAGSVKALWDEDSWSGVPLLVVLSGSSSLLIQRGLSDSLKGRFEALHSTQWFYEEMKDAFGFDLEDFLKYGGYPGAASLVDDDDRWFRYMTDSIVEATISSDILQLQDIRKPALLRRIYELGAYYSGIEMSYRKMLGQLDDRGNTETLAGYLDLLQGAGMLAGIQKYDSKELRSRRSSPKLMVFDTALMSTAWADEASNLLSDASLRGRLIESAVGAYLLNRAVSDGFKVRWWREGEDEVDFVVSKGRKVTGIEVKGGQVKQLRGMAAFLDEYPDAKALVVGSEANPLEGFLLGKVALFS